MIIVDLNELEPYKIIPFGLMEKLFKNHCAKIGCDNCKYKETVINRNCMITYVYEHNLATVDCYNEKYLIINDEERYLIHNKNIYCANRARNCNNCRYNKLIYDKDRCSLGCNTARIISHRIVKGIITQDQYEIVDK